MPGQSRRREVDLRADRFESEMRISDLKGVKVKETYIDKKLYMCSRCQRGFEERSRYCPRCDTKSMGWVRPIPERERERFKRNEIARIKSRRGI